MAFKGGLSFNLDDVIIPEEKENLLKMVMLRLMRLRITITWVSLPIMNVTTRLLIFGHTLTQDLPQR